MFKLVMMLGKAMPEEIVLEKLRESIDNYIIDNSEDNKQSLTLHLTLASAKFMGPDNIVEFDDDLDKIDAAYKMIKFDDN